MRSGLKFHFTKHFAKRVAEREISTENVKAVVCYADEEKKLQPGRNGGHLICFTKNLSNRKLVVVAEIKTNDCWLATAYYEH
jgi:Domain of unknown function (DUF4258)